MKAEHFAANGFYINHCNGYLMKNLVAGFEHSYGLFAFRCVGGRMTQSVGLRQRRLRVLHRRHAVPEAPGVVHR